MLINATSIMFKYSEKEYFRELFFLFFLYNIGNLDKIPFDLTKKKK